MKLDWNDKNVVSRPWIKLSVYAPRIYDGNIDGRDYWHRENIRPLCAEIIEFLSKQEEAWMFNPQDYLNIVQFAVERETTALMVRMMTDAQITIAPMVLRRGTQLRHKDRVR